MSLDDILKEKITIAEVKTAIKSLRSNKAPGWDNVTAEMIKYGGDLLWQCILRICNLITDLEHIPLHYKIGLLVPIPKGTKDRTNQDNHRGLTLLSVLGKIYEKCINERIIQWGRERNIINDIQGAGKEQCSSLHTAWLVKETICAHVENSGNVYIGLLDTKKAFDTVWQDGLFFKLYRLGLRGKVWRILRLMYKGFVCKIKLCGKISSEFIVSQGIHQGAPLSMGNYCMYNNELLCELQQCILGINVHGDKISCVAYADDVAVMAPCENDLQLLFDVAYKYSLKWRFEFNPSKCAVLVFGRGAKTNTVIKLGKSKVKLADNETHLGVCLASNQAAENEHIKDRITTCKSICYGILSIGSYQVPTSPVTASKLYNDVCIPKLCYGVEIMTVGSESLSTMEVFHNTSAKIFQGLPLQCANPGSLGSIGWLSLESVIDLSRLVFMWKVLAMPISCIYKRIMIRRIIYLIDKGQGTGPTWNMVKTYIKYGIFYMLRESVETGTYMDYSEFKKQAKRIVSDLDFRRHKITCTLYKSLAGMESNYKDKQHPVGWIYHMHRAPECSKKCRCIIRLLLNVHRLGKNMCPLCTMFKNDRIEHILFECSSEAIVRTALWNKVLQACPGVLATEINSMDVSSKVKFILNAFKCEYIPEWENVYTEMCNFIYGVYNQYYVQVKHIQDIEGCVKL